METIILYGPYLLISGCVFGFFMAWGIGANDVANAMGTSVGARALTLAQAILVACIFEFAGAYLAGGEVTSTIRKGIIDPNLKAETVRGSKHVLESVKEPNIKRTEEGITIKEAKERLSIEYDIPEDSIEIILKG